ARTDQPQAVDTGRLGPRVSGALRPRVAVSGVARRPSTGGARARRGGGAVGAAAVPGARSAEAVRHLLAERAGVGSSRPAVPAPRYGAQLSRRADAGSSCA